MPVWTVTPVEDQPELTLLSWQVVQLPNGDRHFAGYCTQNREGRASSFVVEMDLQRMRGLTSSGRVYELRGRPGWNSDAEYIWKRWASINEVHEWEDVSKEVWANHLSSKGLPCSS